MDSLADRIAVIDRGKIVAEGTANELKASIGSTSLKLRLAKKGDIKRALGILEKVLGAKGIVSGDASISAPLKAPDHVAGLLTALRKGKIGLSEISVQKPTLDEVFLILTEKRHDEGGLEAADGQPN